MWQFTISNWTLGKIFFFTPASNSLALIRNNKDFLNQHSQRRGKKLIKLQELENKTRTFLVTYLKKNDIS